MPLGKREGQVPPCALGVHPHVGGRRRAGSHLMGQAPPTCVGRAGSHISPYYFFYYYYYYY